MKPRWLAWLLAPKFQSADSGGFSARLFPLQVVGMLSAMVFALNFCLEIVTLYPIGKNHQVLILVLQLGLSGWALVETVLLRQHEKNFPLSRLLLLLKLQLVMEALRMTLLLAGPQFGIGRSYGVHVLNLRQLVFLLPIYILVFFTISKALLFIHAHELESAHEKLIQVAVTESRQHEREELLRDVHDGFGSQLAGVRMMVEKGRIKPEELPGYLSEVSADLHLVVDTLSQTGTTLEEAIHDMRWRTERRFANAGVEFHWELSLDGLPPLSQRIILQILRIMQEALYNAIRHSQAHNIQFSASYQSAQDQLLVCVSDNGTGLPEQPRQGRGLGNMRHRAREIGAQWHMARAQPGTLIELRLDHPGAG